MKHKGFTLTELLITLAVSGVVLASVLAMVVSVSSYSHIRSESAMVNDELNLVKNRITDWFAKNDSSKNPAPSVNPETGELNFGTENNASFKGDTLTLGEETDTTEYVENITFSAAGNFVKCTVSYTLDGADKDYTFLMLKKSDNSNNS